MSQTNKLKKSGEQIAFNWINREELVTAKNHIYLNSNKMIIGLLGFTLECIFIMIKLRKIMLGY